MADEAQSGIPLSPMELVLIVTTGVLILFGFLVYVTWSGQFCSAVRRWQDEARRNRRKTRTEIIFSMEKELGVRPSRAPAQKPSLMSPSKSCPEDALLPMPASPKSTKSETLTSLRSLAEGDAEDLRADSFSGTDEDERPVEDECSVEDLEDGMHDTVEVRRAVSLPGMLSVASDRQMLPTMSLELELVRAGRPRRLGMRRKRVRLAPDIARTLSEGRPNLRLGRQSAFLATSPAVSQSAVCRSRSAMVVGPPGLAPQESGPQGLGPQEVSRSGGGAQTGRRFLPWSSSGLPRAAARLSAALPRRRAAGVAAAPLPARDGRGRARAGHRGQEERSEPEDGTEARAEAEAVRRFSADSDASAVQAPLSPPSSLEFMPVGTASDRSEVSVV